MKKILFITMSLILLSCSGNKTTVEEQTQKQIEISARDKALILKDYTDATELLSIKHKISENNSNKITMEYIKIYDPIRQQIIAGVEDDRLVEKLMNPDESLTKFIERMTVLTGEPSDKVSSYIIDLKMYIKLMEGN